MTTNLRPRNRQGRLASQRNWTDLGNVTLEQAAIAIAERSGLAMDRIEVVVRDDEDLVEYPNVVECGRSYRVTGMRGGE